MEMNTAELKIDTINKITKLKARIIEEIQKILDFELDQGIFQLSEAQNNRIIEAAQDVFLTDEQANKDIDEWLQGK
jgi:metal-sulfur cluster biosynthetic enzyme